MATVSDAYGDVMYGFILASGLALLLFVALLLNLLMKPAERRLHALDRSEYANEAG
jgi:hypothetical protein